MTPKTAYMIATSKNYAEPLIIGSQRKKPDSSESSDQTRRENGILKVMYQRESEIPRMPVETSSNSYLNGSIVSIPYMRPGCYPRVIKIVDPPKVDEKPFEMMMQPGFPGYMPQYHSMMPMEVPPQNMHPNPMMPQMHPMMPMQPQPMSMQPPMGQPMMSMYMPYVPQTQNYPMAPQGVSPYLPMNRAQPMYQPAMLNQFPPQNKKQIIFNPITKKPQNYKTMPCKKFHSGEGCDRGEACHFIHDFNFQGRPIPNFQE